MGINFYKDGDKLVLIIEGMSKLDEENLIGCLTLRAIKECEEAYTVPEEEDIKVNPENLQPVKTAENPEQPAEIPETETKPEISLFDRYKEIEDIKAYVEGLEEEKVKAIIEDIAPCMTDSQKASFVEKYNVSSWEDVVSQAAKTVAMNLIYMVQKQKIKNPIKNS